MVFLYIKKNYYKKKLNKFVIRKLSSRKLLVNFYLKKYICIHKNSANREWIVEVLYLSDRIKGGFRVDPFEEDLVGKVNKDCLRNLHINCVYNDF